MKFSNVSLIFFSVSFYILNKKEVYQKEKQNKKITLRDLKTIGFIYTVVAEKKNNTSSIFVPYFVIWEF